MPYSLTDVSISAVFSPRILHPHNNSALHTYSHKILLLRVLHYARSSFGWAMHLI